MPVNLMHEIDPRICPTPPNSTDITLYDGSILLDKWREPPQVMSSVPFGGLIELDQQCRP